MNMKLHFPPLLIKIIIKLESYARKIQIYLQSIFEFLEI